MQVLCIIPSRLQSTRLPRKPLLNIQGKPMVQWVYESARKCKLINKVIVATDSQEIADVINRINGDVMMTSTEFETGSDRVAAVAATHAEMDVVINLQGDEPFIKPNMLEQLLAPFFLTEKPEMTTLAFPLDRKNKWNDPGVVKVITDLQGNALYFSRAPIPYLREKIDLLPVYHHMGVYAFRHDFLMQYQTFPQTPLEQAEKLEQLRVLEHGYKIRVCLTEERTLEINTPEEYQAALNFVYLD